MRLVVILWVERDHNYIIVIIIRIISYFFYTVALGKNKQKCLFHTHNLRISKWKHLQMYEIYGLADKLYIKYTYCI